MTTVTSSPPAESSRSSTCAGHLDDVGSRSPRRRPRASPRTSPGWQTPAVVSASRVAMRDLAVPGGAGGGGHRDHVVVEAPRRVVHGQRGEHLHGRPGRDDRDPHARLARACVGGGLGDGDARPGRRAARRPRRPCERSIARSTSRVAGSAPGRRCAPRARRTSRRAPASPARRRRRRRPARRASGLRARRPGRAKCVTAIRCGRPATIPASMAAPTSSTWTCTFHSPSPPTTSSESPSVPRVSRSAAIGSSGASSRYITSYAGPPGIDHLAVARRSGTGEVSRPRARSSRLDAR